MLRDGACSCNIMNLKKNQHFRVRFGEGGGEGGKGGRGRGSLKRVLSVRFHKCR